MVRIIRKFLTGFPQRAGFENEDVLVMQAFELITRERLPLEAASPPRESGIHSKPANRSGCMKIVKATSDHWKSECLTLVQAGEVFMVDEFDESSEFFYKNLCYVFHYRMVMTSLGVFFAPAPAPEGP